MTMTTSGMFPFFLNTNHTNCTNFARILHDAAPVRHPDEGFGLTQKSRKAQKGKWLRPCCLRSGINCLTQTTQKTQNTHTQACAGLRGGLNYLTQNSQNTRKFIREISEIRGQTETAVSYYD